MKPHVLSLAKELLNYSPETGVFTWKKSTNRRIVVGSEAGWMHDFGYKVITIGRVKVYAHRLAWEWMIGPIDEVIDHINGDPADNRISNLRACTQSQNIMNYHLSKRNTSGTRGVTYDKSRDKWKVAIKAGDKLVQKRFKTIEEAIQYRASAEAEMFGNFAYSRRAA